MDGPSSKRASYDRQPGMPRIANFGSDGLVGGFCHGVGDVPSDDIDFPLTKFDDDVGMRAEPIAPPKGFHRIIKCCRRGGTISSASCCQNKVSGTKDT